jgi:copper chaperone CopZ
MTCEGCTKKVTNALKSVRGVSRTEVSLERERATIWLDDGANEEKIRSAIRKAGYVVGDIHPRT